MKILLTSSQFTECVQRQVLNQIHNSLHLFLHKIKLIHGIIYERRGVSIFSAITILTLNFNFKSLNI